MTKTETCIGNYLWSPSTYQAQRLVLSYCYTYIWLYDSECWTPKEQEKKVRLAEIRCVTHKKGQETKWLYAAL